jgi:organic hydroperoxide reductase OsmC/OhrA
MAEPKARVFEFEASLDPHGGVTAKDESATPPAGWAPEHLVLAALVDCSLTSLRHHARRAGVEEVAASGEASGTVTRRESDGRFAFVDIECRLEVRLTPPPGDLPALLEKAERDCFIGASLTAKPRYVWNVT